MKFSLIAAIALIALAQGSFAQDAGNLDIVQYLEDFKNKMTRDLTQIFQNPDLANQAQTFLEEKKTQIEPLATQIQDQLRTAMSSLEEQMRPITTNAQTQFQPMVEKLQKQMEAFLQKLTEQVAPAAN